MPDPTHLMLLVAMFVLSVGCSDTGEDPNSAPQDTDTLSLDAPPGFDPLAAGRGRTCLIDGGRVLCWGGFVSSRPDTTGVPPYFSQLPTFTDARLVDNDWGVTAVVDGAGDLWVERANPTPEPGFEPGGFSRVTWLADVIDIAVRLGDVCGLQADGTAFCGRTPVEGVRGVQIAAGIHHACALADDGTIACWGRGAAGVLGRGEVEQSEDQAPDSVLSDARFVWLSADNYSTCAIDDEDDVWCWGGINPAERSDSPPPLPARVEGIAEAAEVAVGGGSVEPMACAILRSGEVWCWGRQSEPVFSGIHDAVEIDGSDHFCVLRQHGEVSCWGANDLGQVGAPVPTPGDDGWVDDPFAVDLPR